MNLKQFCIDNGAVQMKDGCGVIRSENEALEAAKRIWVESVKEDIRNDKDYDEIIQSIIDPPTSKDWEQLKDNCNISTSGDNLGIQANTSLTKVYLELGIHPTRLNFTSWNRAAIKSSLSLADQHFDQVTPETLNNHDWLPSDVHINNIFNCSLDEILPEVSIHRNNQSLPEDEIYSQLNTLDKKLDSCISAADINNSECCEFTFGVIALRFGDGSFIDGMEKLGFEVNDKQKQGRGSYNSNNSILCSIRDELENIDNYDNNADGYVYIINAQYNNISIYYVGETAQIVHRLYGHVRNNLRCNEELLIDDEFKKLSNIDFSIKIHKVLSIYAEDENKLDQKLSYQERLERNKLCKSKDPKYIFGR